MALRRGGAAVRSAARTWFAGATAPRYLPFALFNAAYAGIAGLVIPRLAGDAARAGLAWAAFYLASGAASLAWGRLVGRWGRRATLLVGLALTLLGLAALATAPRAALPLAAALLGGGGAAGQLVATLFVLAWFPRSR